MSSPPRVDPENRSNGRLSNLKDASRRVYREIASKMRRLSLRSDRSPIPQVSKSEPILVPSKKNVIRGSAPVLHDDRIPYSFPTPRDEKNVDQSVPSSAPQSSRLKSTAELQFRTALVRRRLSSSATSSKPSCPPKSICEDNKSSRGKIQFINLKEISVPNESELDVHLPRLLNTFEPLERIQLLMRKLELCRISFTFDSHTETSLRFYLSDLMTEEAHPEKAAHRPSVEDIERHEREAQRSLSDSSKTIQLKRHKSKILYEIADFIAFSSGWFSVERGREVMKTIAINIFRDLPRSSLHRIPGDKFMFLDPSWAHLNIIYEILLRFVSSTEIDSKLLKKCVTRGFIAQLIDNFRSEDHREREYVKSILHKVYGKFITYRSFIRKTMQHTFNTYIYDTDEHHGIGEMLQILASIINGFAVPIKEDHKKLLFDCLIPLHKTKMYPEFHVDLVHCLIQFIEKDGEIAPFIILGVLKFWPLLRSDKSLLFIGELEELMEVSEPHLFPIISHSVCTKLSLCISSENSQIAERALQLWYDDFLLPLLLDHRALILPLIFDSLAEASLSHWSSNVKSLAVNVLAVYKENDEPLYASCVETYGQRKSTHEIRRKERKDKWDSLIAFVDSKNTNDDSGFVCIDKQ